MILLDRNAPQINLFPFLGNRRELIVDFELARRLNISKEALVELVPTAFAFPIARAFDGLHYWFNRFAPLDFEKRAHTCDDVEIELTAQIMRKHDLARRHPEYEHLQYMLARDYVVHVFNVRRGSRRAR